MQDTIAAIATAAGEGGIGIIRISGSQAVRIAEKVIRLRSGHTLQQLAARYAALGEVRERDSVIDEALIIKYAAPYSYTGEDVVEIQAHGGQLLIGHILQSVLACGARLADPGEFTKRAFLNGKMDLAQAESVIGIIRARTEAALKAANRGRSGVLSRSIVTIRHAMLGVLAHIAVATDYPEDDIEDVVGQNVETRVIAWSKEIEQLIICAKSGRILRDGLRTAIVGKPNAGKSSLLNEMLGVERAIVTDIPGTTRDNIEEQINIAGIPIVLIDTAGLRETTDTVERIGVQRARVVAADADLIIYVVDSSEQLDEEQISSVCDYGGKLIVVVNKSDLPQTLTDSEVAACLKDIPWIRTSVINGVGIEELRRAIVEVVYTANVSLEQIVLASVRQVDALKRAATALDNVIAAVRSHMPCDIFAVDLRDAWESLGEITGEQASGDMLDRIFSEFCVGK